MVKANESWPCLQQSAWQWVNQNCMNLLLEPKQEENLPACMNSGTGLLSSDMAFQRSAEPNIPSLRTEQTTEAHGLLHCVPPCYQTLLSAVAPYLKEKESEYFHGLPGKALPNALPVSSQKKFLIFDQCGTDTRLIYSSICPLVTTPIIASTKVTCHYGLHEGEQAPRLDQIESADNCGCEESTMHEDTEELNALLYSSDDECSDEDDEVRSTGHSPMLNVGSYGEEEQFEDVTKEVWSFNFPKKRQVLNTANVVNYEEQEQHEGITEEVSDSNKRQKVVNGWHRKSLMDTATSAKPVESYNLESSSATRKR